MKYCPVAQKCGACAFITTEYEDQLKAKREYVRNLYPGLNVEPVISMKEPYHYRHKIYATFSHERDGKIRAGLYQEDSHKIVNSEMCLIQHTEANLIIQSMCQLATKMGIESYDEDTGRGVLRHSYIRVSHETGDILLVVVIGSKDLPGSHNFVKALCEKHPKIKTVVLNYNHENTSMVLGKKDRILFGPGYIEDVIDGVRFRISAHTFYQVNPEQTEKLYATALKMAGLKESDTVLDMCCGIGTISLIAAKKAAFVLGVEINPQSIRDAIGNAKRNGIRNAQFIAADAEEFIGQLADTPDVVFLDPPRAGFSEDFMKTLLDLGSERVVYVSCNPETQARDCKVLTEAGYEFKKIVPVDMFPFTKSVECVALLTKTGKTFKPLRKSDERKPERRPSRRPSNQNQKRKNYR